jgi:single-strand DNA-binding protein
MSGINKVILIGNLGANPELKYGSNGNAIVNLSLATNEAWTDKSGAKQERVERYYSLSCCSQNCACRLLIIA